MNNLNSDWLVWPRQAVTWPSTGQRSDRQSAGRGEKLLSTQHCTTVGLSQAEPPCTMLGRGDREAGSNTTHLSTKKNKTQSKTSTKKSETKPKNKIYTYFFVPSLNCREDGRNLPLEGTLTPFPAGVTNPSPLPQPPESSPPTSIWLRGVVAKYKGSGRSKSCWHQGRGPAVFSFLSKPQGL